MRIMNTPLPPVLDLISQLVATPSVSSAQAEWDMGNRATIDLISLWCQENRKSWFTAPVISNQFLT